MTTDKPSKKRGNRLGFWFFRAVLKTSGLSAAYAFLYPVCAYYLLSDRTAFRASDAYIRRRFPDSGFISRCLGVLRLYISQGKTLVDRYVSTDSGLSLFDTEVIGYDKMLRVLGESGRGAVLLTAHIGNWQMTMPALGGLGRPVYLMMRPEENAAVSEALRLYEERDWLRILNPNKGDEIGFKVREFVKRLLPIHCHLHLKPVLFQFLLVEESDTLFIIDNQDLLHGSTSQILEKTRSP